MQAEKRTRRKPIKSCLECNRRKQKCNRQKPCNHCTGRAVEHLCIYTNAPPQKSISSDYNGYPPTRRPSSVLDNSEERETSATLSSYDSDSNDMSLEALGHITQGLSFLPITYESLDHVESSRPRRTWPDRSITDFLVCMFLQEINRVYEIIHPPSFQSRYDMWCKSQETNDHSGQAISEDDINFGVLVLRVSLLSIQNLPHSKYPTAGVLSTHLDHLEHWFVTLADELGNFQALERKPSIVTVQHRFYHVCYLQNYAKVRPSWAVLSAAVKDARELGLHMKDPGISLSDLDMELRRRTFWNLYVWDRYMCTFFGLWPLIPEGYFDIDPPHDDLQALTITPYILTPFTDRVFHIKLARYLTAFMSPPSWKDDQHAPAVVAEFAQRFQEVIIDPLPPAYWLENPDTTWDVADTAIPCKREYLHLSIHSTKASLYRAFADPCNHLHRETNTPLKHGTDLLTLSHRRALMDATCKAISSITKLYALTGDEEGGAAERLFMLPTWLVDALACLGVCLLSVQADEGKLAEKGLQINLDQGLRSSFAIFFNGFALLCQQAPQYGLAKRGMKVLESLHDILHASPSRAVRLDANDGETIPLGAFSIGQAGGTSFQLEHALVSLHSRGGEKSHGRNSTALPEWLPSFLESPGRSWLFQDGAFFGNLLA